ncbi:hypothetical protein C1Y63_03565 [Corynebacterium sp. 13CS0277]|uniref:hypothetical protein n=1 Tax=Corynebacterium sp. 13CS0277 TaxID=2071994 RepID=UPI000D02EDC9|nr:hypothetical protein [Corynebacterium sp. 13CS0277]PRQ11944.1 hypothetical protein C1Y63_03565 [Corynebacterium sp. 13CS0277]
MTAAIIAVFCLDPAWRMLRLLRTRTAGPWVEILIHGATNIALLALLRPLALTPAAQLAWLAYLGATAAFFLVAGAVTYATQPTGPTSSAPPAPTAG